MRHPENYRSKIERLYRSWQLCWLPGYERFGKPQEAYCRWRKARAYWTFYLDYGQLDHWCPQDVIFVEALERCGPADEVHNLWDKHRQEVANSASLFASGWRWWNGRGLSESLVYALRDLLIDRYAKACALYESWPVDPIYPDQRAAPGDPQTTALQLGGGQHWP
jgi:hypothetical protein